jgi:protein-tyrosine-phosphatase
MQSLYSIDMSDHRSKLLSAEDVEEAFLIIPVKRDLGTYIAQIYPESSQKLMFLSNDVADPWHAPVAVFQRCVGQMEQLLNQILPYLRTGNEEKKELY